MNFIPYGRQDISQDDIGAVVDVLKSDWLTQGPSVQRFEKTIAEHSGAQHAVAVCNATAALHIACKVLEVGPNDIVWTSPNTFVASANCALYCGAKVDFVDICPNTYNMSVEALRDKLKRAERTGQLPKVVIPVHFSGQACDMHEIKQFSDKYGFKIIEDASHAIGGQYQGKPVGCCEYSDITVFSFHPVKIITTGEGGMCLTNDTHLAEKLALSRTHGIARDQSLMEKESEGAWYYEQLELGFNYRITDLQCALGVSQMKRLDVSIKKRNEIAEIYRSTLQKLPLQLPVVKSDRLNAYHLYVIQVLEESGCSRKEVFDFLRSKNIGVNVHYIPVHLQPYYQRMGFKPGDFPEAEKYYSRAISLPMFPTLQQEEQRFVIEQLTETLS